MDFYLVYLNFSDTTLFSLKWVGDYFWEANLFWVIVGHLGFFFLDKSYIRKLWSLGRRLLHTWGNFKFFYFIFYFFFFIYLYIYIYFFLHEDRFLLGSLLNIIILVLELILLIFILNYYNINLTIVDIIEQVSFISYKRIQVLLHLKSSFITDLLLVLQFNPINFQSYLAILRFYPERLFLGLLDPEFILNFSHNDKYSNRIEIYFLLKKYIFLYFSKKLPSFSEVTKLFFVEWFNLVYVESFKEVDFQDETVYLSQLKVSRSDLYFVENLFDVDKFHSHFLRDFLTFSFCSILYVTYIFIYEIVFLWKYFFIKGVQFTAVSCIEFPLFTWFIYIDSLSFVFIFLLALLTPLCIILHFWKEFKALLDIKPYVTCDSLSNHLVYLVMLYSLIFILCVSFLTRDLFVFYLMFEMSMLPLLFIILQYGLRQNKIKATKYYFFYTLFGSFFFLIALYLLWSTYGTTDYFVLKSVLFGESDILLMNLIWISLFIPFAVKIPIVPFHSWLPEAHVEAPTEGSVLLAGILLKVGAYGIIRFLIMLLPSTSYVFSPFVLVLSGISILYNSFVIFRQVDLKKIIAYFSIIHMNFALLGLFSFTSYGMVASIFIFFIHGLVSSGLFIFVGFLYQRYHTRNYLCYSGLLTVMPLFSCLSFLLILANFGFPGTGSYVGELMILIAIIKKNFFLGIIALISVFSSAIFSLIIFTKMFFGVFRFSVHSHIYSFFFFSFEYFILLYLLFFIFFFGFFPNLILGLFVYY
jgi:proton-translocating NADH-quinone oxidoreductase chain M